MDDEVPGNINDTDMQDGTIQRAWLLASSPVQRLPDEVLSHIFHLCISRRHESNEAHISPIFFTHICKRWTEVAVSNSALWCNIIMTFPLTRPQLVETNVLLLRSNIHPIDIQLDFRDPSWDWEEDTHQFSFLQMSMVIRTLLPHVARWRKLVVLTDTWLPMFSLLLTTSCSVESAPMLHTLSLSRCNAYFAAADETFKPEPLKPPLKLFGGIALTELRQVSLVGVHIDWSQSHLVNLHQLELKYHASDVMPSLDEFLEMLSACPHLSKLSIIGSGPRLEDEMQPLGMGGRSQSPAAPTTITLERLTRFAFGFVDVRYAVDLLSLFRFPALRELEIEDVSFTLNPYEERDASAVLRFLTGNRQRNNTTIPVVPGIPLDQIITLELRGLCAGGDDFVSLFSHTTHLERLVLSDNSDEAILSLGWGAHSPDVLCEDLETLHCRDISYEIVVDTVATRSAVGVRALKGVALEYRGGDVELPQESIAALADAGVEHFALYTNGRLMPGIFP
ncbi:hypothetical protein APHAL10511_000353 [Amanita phalloides]|nr:hypothetical protein APHAL10511_000353 [Amanita phalloides]